jgi:hypothetical protein
MADKPSPSVRKTLSFPPDLWQRVEDYQFRHRIKIDAEVMRLITEAGLDALEKAEARKGRKPGGGA